VPSLAAATSLRSSGATEGVAASVVGLVSALLDGVGVALGVRCLPPCPALVGEDEGLPDTLADGVPLTVGAVDDGVGRTLGAVES